MKKTYRILIHSPGGRYGQLPCDHFMVDENNKVIRFRDYDEVVRRVRLLTESAAKCKHCPPQYLPSYKVV